MWKRNILAFLIATAGMLILLPSFTYAQQGDLIIKKNFRIWISKSTAANATSTLMINVTLAYQNKSKDQLTILTNTPLIRGLVQKVQTGNATSTLLHNGNLVLITNTTTTLKRSQSKRVTLQAPIVVSLAPKQIFTALSSFTVDPDNRIPESNEGNNNTQVSKKVKVPK